MTPALGRPDTRLRKIEESGGLGLDASPTVELEKPSEMFWGGSYYDAIYCVTYQSDEGSCKLCSELSVIEPALFLLGFHG